MPFDQHSVHRQIHNRSESHLIQGFFAPQPYASFPRL